MADTITVKMPQLGESVTEGTIARWFKAVGDAVSENEPLLEVLSDKMNAEVPSEATGTVTEILAREGETVGINQPIAVISTGAPGQKTAAPPAPAPSSSNGSDTGLYPSRPDTMIDLSSTAAAPPPPPATVAPQPAPVAAPAGDASGEQRWREKSSPLVRRILAENGQPLSALDQITGSGAGGRVTKEDVLAFLAARPAQGAPAVAASAAAPAPAALPVPQGVPSWLTPPLDTDAEVQPLAGIRRIIAERLSYSEHVAPHVTTFAEADVTDLVAFRAKHKQWVQDEFGANLTFLPFVVRALCSGLRAFPGLNSSLIGDMLYAHKRIHIGIAVSLDQSGLMIPVIRDADRLSIAQIALAIGELAARARSNQLKPDEMRGSTFTLSNPGAFGGWISTPVINQPNAAILNTGTIKKMPWVMPDDSIVARSIMFLSLSYDHRIVDGETSVKFLQHVRKALESPEHALLS